MAKLLVVDDEANIRRMIRKYAEFEGHSIHEAENGMQAVLRCRDEDFDLIILDIMMPELDGFSACKEIRKSKDIPVLMLSARGEEYDKLHGFELGIDDYVVKPFSTKELMARVNAILARKARAETEPGPVTAPAKEITAYGGLTIDFSGRMVMIDGARAELSPKEYDLLFYLARNQGIALTREKLIAEVWGYDFFGDDRTLDTHIKLLRASLGPYRERIVTLRGVGYRFETE
jgi:DNA-binding response OmpR family regulator